MNENLILLFEKHLTKKLKTNQIVSTYFPIFSTDIAINKS